MVEVTMGSPFPGMAPFLEGSLWTTVHFSLSAEIVRTLAPQVRPRYLVLPVERFVVEMPEGVAISATDIYPDVDVASLRPPQSASAPSGVLAAPLLLETVVPDAIPHVTIEIRERAGRRLVTAIEVLSPTNKRGEGLAEYLAKRRRILHSSAHLMEIDLLRPGQRVPMQQPLPAAPYFVFLSRAGERPLTGVWPIALDQPLPTVPIPLLPDDADVPLDLQQAFTSMYELLGLDLAVDYTAPPEVPLAAQEAAWVDAHLRQAGARV